MPTEPAAELKRGQIRLLARRRMSVTLSAVQLRQEAEAWHDASQTAATSGFSREQLTGNVRRV